MLNDKETAERILHKLHDFSESHEGFDIGDIEHIVIDITGDRDFGIDTDYVLFTQEDAHGVYLISRKNEYEIIFPPQGKAITLGCWKED